MWRQKSAVDQVMENKGIAVDVCQSRYVSKIVEQDPWAVKHNSRSMLGFKSFLAATCPLASLELSLLICECQIAIPGCEALSVANPFDALARQVHLA